MERRAQEGFSLIELLISLTVLTVVMTGLATMLIQNSKLNKNQQMAVQVQADARNTMEMVVQRLRSAGWDPHGIGFDAVTLDPDTTDSVSQIEVRADLNDDNDIDDPFEQLLIRHSGTELQWRTTPTGSFETLAINITNDADGDGIVEPMFTVDADPPTRITVTITAQSAVPNPDTGDFIRYSLTSNVVLREAL